MFQNESESSSDGEEMHEEARNPPLPDMTYGTQILPDSSSNNSSSSSVSQYVTVTLGVGLVVLGMVMILWSLLPGNTALNTTKPIEVNSVRNSVGFILLGTGAAMMLLSLFIRVRNKHLERTQQYNNSIPNPVPGEAGESLPSQAEQFTVPSYEEVVGSDQYPIRQFSPRLNSTTQLPAYDELMDRTQNVVDGSTMTATQPDPTQIGLDVFSSAQTLPSPLPPKDKRFGFKMLSLKMRSNSSSSPPITVSCIEPLTPPPLYEESPPELRVPAQ